MRQMVKVDLYGSPQQIFGVLKDLSPLTGKERDLDVNILFLKYYLKTIPSNDDVDILIKREDVKQLTQILFSHGWQKIFIV